MIKKLTMFSVFALILFAIAGNQVFCQSSSKIDEETINRLKMKPLNFFFGLGFSNEVPQGEFMDEFPKTGLGLNIYGGYYFDPIPVSIGLEANFLFNGSTETYYEWSWKDPANHWWNEKDTKSTQNMLIPIYAFVRLQPNIGNIFMPYVEGIIGMNIWNSSYTYNTSFSYNNKDNDKTDNKTSVAFNYGIGVGVLVKIVDFIELPATNVALSLDFRMRYIKGSEIDYSEWKLEGEGSNVDLKEITHSSKTDMVLTQIGVAVRF